MSDSLGREGVSGPVSTDVYAEAGREGARISNMPGLVACQVCAKRLTGKQKRYCSKEHRLRAKQLRQLDREDELGDGMTVRGDTSRPETVSPSVAQQMKDLHDAGWTYKEIGAKYGKDSSTVNRIVRGLEDEQKAEKVRAGWEPPPREFPEEIWELELEHLEALLQDFLWFRGEFFTTKRGTKYWTPPFQMRWIKAVLKALITGGRLVILSPVRHGKTELMIHFSVWLIARFPNVSILWIGGNERIAQKSVAHILRILTNNEDLIEAFAGPGGSFKPGAREGLPWSKTEFIVATRTREVKGSTMLAIGRGGTTASLDADIAIGDDIEDFKSTVQPGSRENTRDWWTSDFESRKEEHTALFLIGSRTHIDDLAGHLIESDEYDSIVETAHDPICEIPQDDPELYDEHDECMLFPQLRSFRWLMQQKRASAAGGGVARFNMVYLNQVEGEGMTIFVAAEIAACRSKNYAVGQIPSPVRPDSADTNEDLGGISLVAGLDPSGSGYQAAFLWAYQVKPELHMWMMDLENHEGGGIAQARKTIEAWHELHGVSHWVIEENLYHGGIVQDEALMELRQRLGILVEPHRTGTNKWDNHLGVSTLRPLFRDQKITLPYANSVSVTKSDLYQRQLVRFSDAPRNRNRTGDKDDVVMASWFPMTVIRRARMEYVGEAGVEYEQSYAGYRGSSWNSAPWGSTRVA